MIRVILNFLCLFAVISSCAYFIVINFGGHKFKYAILVSDNIRGLFKGNPVSIGGHTVGKVHNIKLYNSSSNNPSFLVMIESSDQLDTSHMTASLSMDNFIIGSQSVSLQWSEVNNALPDISGLQQIKYKESSISRLQKAFSKIDTVKLESNFESLSNIIRNTDLFMKSLNSLVDLLSDNVLVNDEFQTCIREVVEHIRRTAIQMRMMFSQKVIIDFSKTIGALSDITSKIQVSLSRNSSKIDDMMVKCDRIIDGFSKSPLKFLRHGLQDNRKAMDA